MTPTKTIINRAKYLACIIASVTILYACATASALQPSSSSSSSSSSSAFQRTLTSATIQQHRPIATTSQNQIALDAPKYYHLNELLYKTTNGNESPQAVALPNLRPLDGAHLKPRDMKTPNDDDDGARVNGDDSPIDGSMRGLGPQQEPSSFMRGVGDASKAANRGSNEGALTRGQADVRNNIGPDDDATVQRKSTNLDDDSVDESPAKLRARNAVSRRRRRASTRQAPPKLTSRRASRNSRRRKLRHGIKPRRRA